MPQAVSMSMSPPCWTFDRTHSQYGVITEDAGPTPALATAELQRAPSRSPAPCQLPAPLPGSQRRAAARGLETHLVILHEMERGKEKLTSGIHVDRRDV